MAGISKAERERRELEKKNTEVIGGRSDIEKENIELKAQLEEMKKNIEKLQSQSEPVSDNNVDSIESIDMNTRISVTSITDGGVNLRTSEDGSARFFRLEKRGQTLPIVYEHLINCINTDRWIFEDGLIYINNPKAVEEQYLEDAYKKFLTPDKIENILSFDSETIKDMVLNTTFKIQETIARLVANKINDKEVIDMNKVEVIGKSCNPQIDIRALADKLK